MAFIDATMKHEAFLKIETQTMSNKLVLKTEH